MKRLGRFIRYCLNCAHHVKNDNTGYSGCGIGEQPLQRNLCLAKVVIQKLAECSKCGELSTDWDWIGDREKGTDRRICRGCLCPDTPILIPIRFASPLAKAQDEMLPIDFSLDELNNKAREAQQRFGVPDKNFASGGLKKRTG